MLNARRNEERRLKPQEMDQGIVKKGKKKRPKKSSTTTNIKAKGEQRESADQRSSEHCFKEDEKTCVNEELRKLGLIDPRSTPKSSKRNKDDHYRIEPNKDLLTEKLEVVAREKAQFEELLRIEEEEKSKQHKSWDPTGNEIKPSDMEFCLKHTNFTSEEIEHWFKGFRVECPNGRLTKTHLHSLFCKLLPGEDSEAFCNHIFRIFDSDGNNFLDFKEFLMALDVSSLRSEREKLEWAFRLYDSDYSGSINLQEIKAVMETFSALGGIDSGDANGHHSEELSYLTKMNPGERAEYMFSVLDVDNDGEISLEEFVEGYMKLANGEEIKNDNESN